MKAAQDHLSSKGIHASQQRIAIMDYLLKHPTHPTADEIYLSLCPSMPTLSKTTVYNTLKLLEEQGAVMSITIDEKNLRYDATTSSHAHFRCRCCGKIFDLELGGCSEPMAEGFHIESTQTYLYGMCPKCKDDNL